MKNLLLVIFLMLGSICQAQKVEINGYVYFENTPETYLSKRIDSLEKRIVSLEKIVKVLYDKHIQDSLYYQRLVQPVYRWPQIQFDSIVPFPHYPLVDTIWSEPNIKIETLLESQEIYRIKKRKSR